MRKRFSFVAVAAAVALLLTSTATFASPPEVLHGNPFHRTRNAGGKPGGSGNLVYHAGGAVQTGTHKTYAIYWGTDFSYNNVNTYQSLINGYFQNVAADSGKSSNVYWSDTQYYQTIGTQTYITYSEAFGGTWSDTVLPASGCSSTAGGTVACVSDAQVAAEVQKALVANPTWPHDMSAEYFVFLANGVSTCSGSSCFISNFCAYHTHYVEGTNNILYANMPFTGYQLSSCSGAVGSPNNNAAADATISVTSHEANETITDALGNAWYDSRGNENGDKCAYNYGTALGTVNGGNYNQLIGTGKYEMQQEWSNAHSGCVLTGR